MFLRPATINLGATRHEPGVEPLVYLRPMPWTIWSVKKRFQPSGYPPTAPVPDFQRPAGADALVCLRRRRFAKGGVEGVVVDEDHGHRQSGARFGFGNSVGKGVVAVIALNPVPARGHEIGPFDGKTPSIGMAPVAVDGIRARRTA